MCSNFQPISKTKNAWVKKHFNTDLPDGEWRDDAYPAFPSPFVLIDQNKIKCEIAKFGLIPHWAIDIPNFEKSKYNARAETVSELRSYKEAWKACRFGLVLMDSFYEPNYEVGVNNKSTRYRIMRADGEPSVAACIYERVIDRTTGEVIFTFSMLTINATNHSVMKRFHKPEDEKRSIVILQDSDYQSWLNADHDEARRLLQLAPENFLTSESAPKPLQIKRS